MLKKLVLPDLKMNTFGLKSRIEVATVDLMGYQSIVKTSESGLLNLLYRLDGQLEEKPDGTELEKINTEAESLYRVLIGMSKDGWVDIAINLPKEKPANNKKELKQYRERIVEMEQWLRNANAELEVRSDKDTALIDSICEQEEK